MPSQKNTPARQRAQRKFNGKPSEIKRRAGRNKGRALMVKAGRARKGDGKDVDHKNGNPLQNKMDNLIMRSQKTNRTLVRTKNAKKRRPNGK